MVNKDRACLGIVSPYNVIVTVRITDQDRSVSGGLGVIRNIRDHFIRSDIAGLAKRYLNSVPVIADKH